MTRIIEQSNVTLTREAVAPKTVIHWNPEDNSGSVQFHVQQMEFIDGQFQRYIPGGVVSVSLADLMPRSFMVGEVEVPTPLVMGYIKAAFDSIYTEREAAAAEQPVEQVPDAL